MRVLLFLWNISSSYFVLPWTLIFERKVLATSISSLWKSETERKKKRERERKVHWFVVKTNVSTRSFERSNDRTIDRSIERPTNLSTMPRNVLDWDKALSHTNLEGDFSVSLYRTNRLIGLVPNNLDVACIFNSILRPIEFSWYIQTNQFTRLLYFLPYWVTYFLYFRWN